MGTSRERSWTIRTGEDIGRAVAGVRQARRLTQQDLAELTGIRQNYFAKLEAGVLTPVVLDRVVRALRRMGATITITVEEADATSR